MELNENCQLTHTVPDRAGVSFASEKNTERQNESIKTAFLINDSDFQQLQSLITRARTNGPLTP